MKRVASFLTFLMGGAFVVALFDFSGIINDFTYNSLYAGKYGFGLIMDLVNNIKEGFSFGVDTTLVPILVAAAAVFAALTTLFGLIGLFTKKGGCGASCVFAILTLIVSAAILIIVLAVNKADVEGAYGLYAFLGLSVLMTLFGLLSKPRKGGRKGGYDGPRGGYVGPRGGRR